MVDHAGGIVNGEKRSKGEELIKKHVQRWQRTIYFGRDKYL